MKNKKVVMLVASLLLVSFAGTVYAVSGNKENVKVENQKQTEKNGLNDLLTNAIKSIYLDKKQDNVKTKVDDKTISDAKKLIIESKKKTVDKKLVKQLQIGLNMYSIQGNINNLFESEGIAKYSTDVEKTVPNIKEDLTKMAKKKSYFAKEQEQRLVAYQSSYNHAKDAETSVNDLFNEDEIKEDVTQEKYDAVFQKVASVKQKDLSVTLGEKLQQVKAELDNKVQLETKQQIEAMEQQGNNDKDQVQSNNPVVTVENENPSDVGQSNNTPSNAPTPTAGGSAPQSSDNNGTRQQPTVPASPPAPNPPANSGGTSWNGNNPNNGGTTSGGTLPPGTTTVPGEEHPTPPWG